MNVPEYQPPKPNKASRIASWIALNIPQIVDWLLGLTARITVFLLGIFTVYLIFVLLFGDISNTRIEKVLSLLADNWKALLVLGFPIFYQSIRSLLPEAEIKQYWPLRIGPRPRKEGIAPTSAPVTISEQASKTSKKQKDNNK